MATLNTPATMTLTTFRLASSVTKVWICLTEYKETDHRRQQGQKGEACHHRPLAADLAHLVPMLSQHGLILRCLWVRLRRRWRFSPPRASRHDDVMCTHWNRSPAPTAPAMALGQGECSRLSSNPPAAAWRPLTSLGWSHRVDELPSGVLVVNAAPIIISIGSWGASTRVIEIPRAGRSPGPIAASAAPPATLDPIPTTSRAASTEKPGRSRAHATRRSPLAAP